MRPVDLQIADVDSRNACSFACVTPGAGDANDYTLLSPRLLQVLRQLPGVLGGRTVWLFPGKHRRRSRRPPIRAPVKAFDVRCMTPA